MTGLSSNAARMCRRLLIAGREGERYIPGRESVKAREIILWILSGGVVNKIFEFSSRADFDIFLVGSVNDVIRGYEPSIS